MHVQLVFDAQQIIYMPLYLNESIARRRFKDLLGNGNQLLITILVGLSAVERGLIKECPVDLRAAWNPRSPKDSAARSRVMTLEMTLVRATDALDVYISLARRAPYLIQQPILQKAIDSGGQSVLEKFRAVKNSCSSMHSVIASLVEVMIAWRNRSVHSLSDNDVSDEIWTLLLDNKDWIENEFGGMEVGRLFSDFNRDGPPTFKEMASFIRSTHEAVRILDEHYLRRLDGEQFLRAFVWWVVSRNADQKNVEKNRKRLIQSVWGRDCSERRQRVVSFLRNNGLSQNRKVDGGAAVFCDELIAALGDLTPNALLEFVRPNEGS